MFEHSIKVPRLYKTAAKVAKDANGNTGSIKQLVYANQKKHPNLKAIYSLVATLFQHSEEIENLLKRSQILTKEPRLDLWLTKVLIVELLWGKNVLPGNSKPVTTVQAYEQIFKAHISDVSSAPKNIADKASNKPRYVRVNTLLVSLNEAVDSFRDEGWNLCKFLDKKNYKAFLEKISNLADGEFLIDVHIPDLLIFPPKTEFYRHPAYKHGSIILQDKASCLPVHILAPPSGSTVLDMCAAPGMKTTQVAAAINNNGTVYAVERNPTRFEVLTKIVESSGATCVKPVCKDVLTCNSSDFPGVQYILVDPSCTGSGITNRLESEREVSNERIDCLAGFQIKILRSALTRYPDAKRVIYSTCSIHPQENEDVVRQVLETNTAFKLVPAKQFVNDTWQNFGSSEFGDIGKYCLYAKPNEDLTNGFFVAVFERLEEGETNVFFNTKVFNYIKHVQNQKKRQDQWQQQSDVHNIEQEFENAHNQHSHTTYVNTSKIVTQDGGYEVSDAAKGTNLKNKKKTRGKKEILEENDLTSLQTDGNSAATVEDNNYINNVEQAFNDNEETTKHATKKRKKNKENNEGDSADLTGVVNEETVENTSTEKSKKKKLKKDVNEETEDNAPKKKNKRKRNNISEEIVEQIEADSTDVVPKKKKKKRSKDICEETVFEEDPKRGIAVELQEMEKNKSFRENNDLSIDSETVTVEKTKKKKKKKKNKELLDLDISEPKC